MGEEPLYLEAGSSVDCILTVGGAGAENGGRVRREYWVKRSEASKVWGYSPVEDGRSHPGPLEVEKDHGGLAVAFCSDVSVEHDLQANLAHQKSHPPRSLPLAYQGVFSGLGNGTAPLPFCLAAGVSLAPHVWMSGPLARKETRL